MSLLTKRQKKQLISAILALIIIAVGGIVNKNKLTQPSIVPTPSDPAFHTVTSFADGDTITVQIGDKKEKVRLLGVDTPETNDPRKAVQCFGKAASQFTEALIGTNSVRLEADPLNSDRDRYDRLLRYVYLPDGTLVNAEIIKQGYGFAYLTYPIQKNEEFKNYENQAREAGKGLWGSCTVGSDTNGNRQINDAN